MSLHPQSPNQIPPDTFRVAVAAFPKGNIYILMRDELGTIYTDEAFAPLFPVQGKMDSQEINLKKAGTARPAQALPAGAALPKGPADRARGLAKRGAT